MDIITDHEGTAVPYQLCSVCKQVAPILTDLWLSIMEVNVDEDRSAIDIGKQKTQMQHHASVEKLQNSAAKGCHLCTLFVSRMIWDDSDLEANEEQLLIFTKTDKQTSSLDVCLSSADPPAPEAYQSSIVTLYRSVSQDTPVLGNAGEPDIALENQLRWSASTKATIMFEMISNWLRQCVEEHDHCRRQVGELSPTRLLDLDAFPDCEDLRTVLTSDIGGQRYAALSYCWGKQPTVTLRSKNYRDFLSRIRYAFLPETIRDAIAICRKLSIRYLWVDALCIIQGDSTDFAHEVSHMGSIYAGSLITVAAGASEHCDAGIFRPRLPLRDEDCLYRTNDGLFRFAGSATRNKCEYHDGDIECEILNRRAWVYQERMMSPRTIHFCESEVVWECRTRTMCQRCAGTDISAQHDKRLKDIFVYLQEDQTQTERSSSVIENFWPRIVAGYSCLDLSDEEDRLNALAGIAEFVHQRGYSTSYGLLLPNFLNELLWQADGNERESQGCNADQLAQAPSWCWLFSRASVLNISDCIKGEVLYCGEVLKSPPATAFGSISALTAQWPPHSIRIELRGHLQSCQLMNRTREYQGCALSKWVLMPTKSESQTRATTDHHMWNGEDDVFGRQDVRPDPPAALEEGAHLLCLLVKRTVGEVDLEYHDPFRFDDPTTDCGLILRLRDDDEGRYQRVGFFFETAERTQHLLFSDLRQEVNVEIE